MKINTNINLLLANNPIAAMSISKQKKTENVKLISLVSFVKVLPAPLEWPPIWSWGGRDGQMKAQSSHMIFLLVITSFSDGVVRRNFGQ